MSAVYAYVCSIACTQGGHPYKICKIGLTRGGDVPMELMKADLGHTITINEHHMAFTSQVPEMDATDTLAVIRNVISTELAMPALVPDYYTNTRNVSEDQLRAQLIRKLTMRETKSMINRWMLAMIVILCAVTAIIIVAMRHNEVRVIMPMCQQQRHPIQVLDY